MHAQLGVVRPSPFSPIGTLVTLALGFVWWEAWFYAGHRLLHSLETQAPARDRETEAQKAKARAARSVGVGA